MSQKISVRTAAGTLTGAEIVGVIQGGADRRTTIGDFMLNAAVRQTTMASAVTQNTTSATSTIPTGAKTFYGVLTGTGSIIQTQAIYGTFENSNANGVLLATLVLDGSTRVQEASNPIEQNFSYYYVVTTETFGTGVSGSVYAMY